MCRRSTSSGTLRDVCARERLLRTARFGGKEREAGVGVDVGFGSRQTRTPPRDDLSDMAGRPGGGEQQRAVFVRRGQPDVHFVPLEAQDEPSSGARQDLGRQWQRRDLIHGADGIGGAAGDDDRGHERFGAPHRPRGLHRLHERTVRLDGREQRRGDIPGAPQRQRPGFLRQRRRRARELGRSHVERGVRPGPGRDRPG